MPKTPECMRGVINLRGSVVPVLDMGLKLGLAEIGKTVDTCVIVVEASCKGETTIIGALVNSVEEVLEFDPEQIEPAPKIGTQLRTDFVKGMGKKDDGFVIILDVDKVFSLEDLAGFQGMETEEQIPMAGNE